MIGTAPWQQETALLNKSVKSIIQLNIPELKLASISQIGEGWDNTAWLINGIWVFRFPKHKDAVKLLLNEINLLPQLTQLQPIQIPAPKYIILFPKGFAYPFYAYPYLSGETAERTALSESLRVQLAKPLGRFLKKLHSFPLAKAKSLNIKYDQLGRADVKKRLALTKPPLQYLADRQLIDQPAMYLQYFERFLDFDFPEHWVLGHGDFDARHIVLDQNKQLTAVLDWGNSELLHAAVDLRVVYQFLPAQSHDTFWQAYGAVDETTRTLAKLCAIHSAVIIAWYASEIADKDLLRESLGSLHLLKEHIE